MEKNELLYEKFKIKKGYDMYSHFCEGVIVEDFIATAKFLCPDFYEVEEIIFFAEPYSDVKDLESYIKSTIDLHSSKLEAEKWINAISIGEFFSNQNSQLLDDINILNTIYEIIQYFWSARLKQLFPNKKFIFEMADELMGELGLSITFYHLSGDES